MRINEEDLPSIAATITAGLVAANGGNGINPRGAVDKFFSVLKELERQNATSLEGEPDMKVNL